MPNPIFIYALFSSEYFVGAFVFKLYFLSLFLSFILKLFKAFLKALFLSFFKVLFLSFFKTSTHG